VRRYGDSVELKASLSLTEAADRWDFKPLTCRDTGSWFTGPILNNPLGTYKEIT